MTTTKVREIRLQGRKTSMCGSGEGVEQSLLDGGEEHLKNGEKLQN